MRHFRFLITIFALFLGSLSWTSAAPKVGEKAPDFRLPSAAGQTHKLSDFQGKFVVLEWTNYGCPFVRKHYDSQNMQKLQREWTEEGVVWLSICSSAKGKQGYLSAAEAKKAVSREGSQATAYLLDPEGKVGRLYGAKTTPHMFVLDKKGRVLYSGAIDSIASFRKNDVPKAVNYVEEALSQAVAGGKVKRSYAKPYGCSVKY